MSPQASGGCTHWSFARCFEGTHIGRMRFSENLLTLRYSFWHTLAGSATKAVRLWPRESLMRRPSMTCSCIPCLDQWSPLKLAVLHQSEEPCIFLPRVRFIDALASNFVDSTSGSARSTWTTIIQLHNDLRSLTRDSAINLRIST